MNKSRWKHICWVLGFAVLFVICFIKINEIVRYKVRECDVIASFYKEPENSIDVIFAGTSKVYRSISPMQLWHEQGITGYVLGTPSQSIAASYFLIKESLRTQKPKLVVLDIYGTRYDDYFYDRARLHLSIDDIPWGKTRLELVTDFLPRVFPTIQGRMEYIIPFLKFHSRWSTLTEADFSGSYDFMKGFSAECYVYENGKKPKKTKKEEEVFSGNMEYFLKIVDLCRETGTELVLTRIPVNRYKGYKKDLKRQNTILARAAGLGLETIDFEKRLKEVGIDRSADFMDKKHLNLSGAQKMTAWFGNYLARKGGFEDHREDPAYASWNEDYADYLAYCAMKEENKTPETSSE